MSNYIFINPNKYGFLIENQYYVIIKSLIYNGIFFFEVDFAYKCY